MATYLIVNIVFIAFVTLVLRIKPIIPTRHKLLMLVLLTILTAIFDSLLISFGIVEYDLTKITGIRIGTAPIEDFFYPLLAVIIIPAIWEKLHNKS